MSRGVILLCNNSTIHTKLTGRKRRELFIIRNIPLLSGRQRCQLQWWRWQGHQTRQDLREGRMWPKESCFDPGTWQMSRHYWHSNQTSSLSTDPCRQMTFICSTNDLARSLMMFIRLSPQYNKHVPDRLGAGDQVWEQDVREPRRGGVPRLLHQDRLQLRAPGDQGQHRDSRSHLLYTSEYLTIEFWE